ncbi:MAG: hypothetical protein QXV37_02750, partial [Candidatus Jordarchaeaceae archaeon]
MSYPTSLLNKIFVADFSSFPYESFRHSFKQGDPLQTFREIRWRDGTRFPRCSSTRLKRHGNCGEGLKKYRCKTCGRNLKRQVCKDNLEGFYLVAFRVCRSSRRRDPVEALKDVLVMV